MEKITEALKSVLPEGQVNEVAKAVQGMIAEQYNVLKEEFEDKLSEAYEQHLEERKNDEAIAEQGYQQAYEEIHNLMKRLEEQKREFEIALEEGFEEAYEELQEAQAANENVETDLYEEFDKKLREMKEVMVDKVDQFLNLQEAEIYEHAKRDILNDPSISEQRVAVGKIADIVADYIDRDDIHGVMSSKLEETHKNLDQLRGQLKIIEARNVKLSAQNGKLNEQVQEAHGLITEATKSGRKERANKTGNVSGRGKKVVREELIGEYVNPETTKREGDRVVTESNDAFDNEILILSGIQEA